MFRNRACWHPATTGRLLGAALLLILFAPAAPARELAVDEAALIRVEIATIAVADTGAPVVLLREPGAREVIPIFIGPAEAQSIAMAMRGIRMPRPLAHDLLAATLAELGVRLRRVLVDDLADNTYFGMLELQRQADGKVLRVDSRPSDALALAVRTGARIYVAPNVLEAAANVGFSGLDDEVVTAIGITVSALTEALRDALDLPAQPGLLVTQALGPARELGLAAGALLLEVNGETPSSPMHFLELVRATPPGEKASLRYWQDGEEHHIEIATDVPDIAPEDTPEIPRGLQRS